MPEPWFDTALFSPIFCGVAGGIGGALLGIAGGVGGGLARKGQRRSWVRGTLATVFVFGVVSFAAGIAALTVHQPVVIWLTLAAVGAGLSYFAWGIGRTLRRMYERAKQGLPIPP